MTGVLMGGVLTAGVDGAGFDAAAGTGLGGAIAAMAAGLAMLGLAIPDFTGVGFGLGLTAIDGRIAGVALAFSFEVSSGTLSS